MIGGLLPTVVCGAGVGAAGDAMERARDAAVAVEVVRVREGVEITYMGHGVLVGPRRVVTVLHLSSLGDRGRWGRPLEGARLLVRDGAGRERAARIVAARPRLDLALLELEAPLGIAVATAPVPADGRLFQVTAAGGVRPRRVVAAYPRSRSCRVDFAPSGTPGDSGAGLFDAQGRLVAVVVGGQGQLGTAVPVGAVVGPADRPARAGADLHPACEAFHHERRGELAPLERAARRWVRLMPGDASAWETLGAALVGLERTAEGVDALRRAARLDPDRRSIWQNLAVAHLAMERASLARWCAIRMLRLDPHASQGWALLALAYMVDGRWREAHRAARRAVEWLSAAGEGRERRLTLDERARVWDVYADAAYGARRYAEALNAYQQAIMLTGGGEADHWLGLAWSAIRAGDGSRFDGDAYPELALHWLEEEIGEPEAAQRLRAIVSGGRPVPSRPPGW